MGLTARFVGCHCLLASLVVWLLGSLAACLFGRLSGQAQICLCKLNEMTVKMPNKLICG